MHSTPVSVYRCDGCRSIFRDPAAVPRDLEARYRLDAYPERELERLRTCEVAAFAEDRGWWRAHVLVPGSRVLEVGSYVGGFLTLARRSACDATGLDVGLQVSAFTRALGLDVRTGVFDPDEFAAESFDVVVVLNCLEQLANPPATLNQIRRVLRRHGVLVVRTPNAAFVKRAHEPPVRHQRSPMVCSALRSYAVGQLLRLTGCSNDRALQPSASKGAWWARDAAVLGDRRVRVPRTRPGTPGSMHWRASTSPSQETNDGSQSAVDAARGSDLHATLDPAVHAGPHPGRRPPAPRRSRGASAQRREPAGRGGS